MQPSTLKTLARVGYTAHGLVYGLVGLLAGSAVLSGARPKGEKAVWRAVLEQPFGKFLLILIGCGLLAYAVFRTVESVSDSESKGSDVKGLFHRAGAMASAFANAILGVAALGAAIPSAAKAVTGSESGGHSAQSVTAEALSQPFGEWLVGLAGVVMVFTGFFQIVKAWSLSHMKKLSVEQMSSAQMAWASRLGAVGIVARALIFLVTGSLIVKAGFHQNAAQTGSLQAALQAVEAQGPWYLILLAAGLVAYAAFQLFMARYAKIPGSSKPAASS